MSQQQQNDELHEIVFWALCKAAEAVSEEQLIALCFACGISYKDVLEAAEADMEPHKRTGYAEKMADYADNLRKAKREQGEI